MFHFGQDHLCKCICCVTMGDLSVCMHDQPFFHCRYVYTAPSDMLDSQPGTLMLTDCIDTCARNSSCKSINYETGLCVLFSSSADDSDGKLKRKLILLKPKTRILDEIQNSSFLEQCHGQCQMKMDDFNFV